MTDSTPFNPLAMANLGDSMVTHMITSDPVPLEGVPRFVGAGVYALYYTGPFPAYAALAARNQDGLFEQPIYVGKAVPQGGRRGLEALDHTTTTALTKRLRDHAASVALATNLDVADFTVRWLVVEDIWIALGESALLRRYRPVWNALIDGFGNHAVGKGRNEGLRSRWDTLHPGRAWAAVLRARDESPVAVEQEVVEYLRSRL